MKNENPKNKNKIKNCKPNNHKTNARYSFPSLTSCYHDPITFYQFYQQSNKQQVILTVKPTETQCSSSKLFQVSAQRNCEKNQTNQSTSKAFDFKH